MKNQIRELEGNILECKNYWCWNIKTKKCFFSEAWCENLGYRFNEIVHHEDTWKSFVHKDCLQNVWSSLDPVISGKKDFYECIYRLKNKNDKYIWHLDSGRVLKRDTSGQALLLEGYDLPICY